MFEQLVEAALIWRFGFKFFGQDQLFLVQFLSALFVSRDDSGAFGLDDPIQQTLDLLLDGLVVLAQFRLVGMGVFLPLPPGILEHPLGEGEETLSGFQIVQQLLELPFQYIAAD